MFGVVRTTGFKNEEIKFVKILTQTHYKMQFSEDEYSKFESSTGFVLQSRAPSGIGSGEYNVKATRYEMTQYEPIPNETWFHDFKRAVMEYNDVPENEIIQKLSINNDDLELEIIQ